VMVGASPKMVKPLLSPEEICARAKRGHECGLLEARLSQRC
jgi:hypothetical protein